MGWIERLPRGTVANDTAPIIAFIAKETPHIERSVLCSRPLSKVSSTR